mmetsp:Transcript_17698/g.44493  ORF Transcript_17698/g.44493 Transcript_17698/m.44493 type:complete len:254 (+) Transcript_17698:199-960(+)
MAVSRTSRSGSNAQGATEGKILVATSMGLWYCCVAVSDINAAQRPGPKGSLSARQQAGMSTFSRVDGSMYAAILPRQMVVLVRMADSSSSCSLAKARMTCCIDRGSSLGARGTIALTVSSRSTGEVSTKPIATCWKTESLSSRVEMCGTSTGSRSSSGMRIARSGLAKSLTIVGTTCACISSSVSTWAILSSGSRALAEPPPYSRELTSAGRTFHCAAALGSAGILSVSLLKKRSFSTESFTLSVSRKRWSET